MGYQTRFNIGEAVYFIANDVVNGPDCPVCGARGPKRMVPTVKRSRINGIEIGANGVELYGLTANRVLSIRYLYSSRETAEKELARIEEELTRSVGGTTDDE